MFSSPISFHWLAHHILASWPWFSNAEFNPAPPLSGLPCMQTLIQTLLLKSVPNVVPTLPSPKLHLYYLSPSTNADAPSGQSHVILPRPPPTCALSTWTGLVASPKQSATNVCQVTEWPLPTGPPLPNTKCQHFVRHRTLGKHYFWGEYFKAQCDKTVFQSKEMTCHGHTPGAIHLSFPLD